ncbi:unnamed protein product [Paramecium pentaurelia]|uniref:Uncharacterized protein n=1 Tax=Paramecium pentaurelia TaxID=43138 RepID=A0A8S1TSH0_9CILI|nr:unnamed protein product [Paramecium pentaurelia]
MTEENLLYAADYFAFLGKKISDHEIQSMLPFFDCEEPGHQGNALDQVCLDSECKYKGLCCVRCQYQKHRFHPNSVYPLHTFVSQLINQLSSRKIILEEQRKKCNLYRDVVISILRDYLNSIIEHMSLLVASLHKYFTSFENAFETTIIKSHIIAHSLIYKKHIPKDKFEKFVREGIKGVSFQNQEPKKSVSNDYYILNQSKPTRLEEKLKQEYGNIIINEQEKAFEMTQDYIDIMQSVAQKLQTILKKSQDYLAVEVDLNKLSPRIPKFELAQLQEFDQKFKKQFQIDGAFSIFKGIPPPAPQKKEQEQMVKLNTSAIPTLNDYLHKESQNTIIDPSRQKCILGMLFETLSNCSILKLGSVKSTQSEVSCFVPLNSDLIAIAARFNPYIEIYRIQDKKIIQKIDTKSQQGVKCLLAMSKPLLYTNTSAESEITLVVGQYYDSGQLLSYQLQIFRNEGRYTINSQSAGQFHKPDQSSAATCFAELYSGEFFVAGYSTGSVSIYHIQNPQALHVLNFLYEKPVQGISIVEPGKLFMSFSQDKSRLHMINSINSERVVHNVSQVKMLANNTFQIISTDALNDDKSTLKLIHFVCGEQKEYHGGDQKEQGLRFLRMMKDDSKLSLVEEGSISNFRDLGVQNSVKDLIILEPRKKMSKIWVLAVGENNKLQLWEVRRAMSQNIKLWEKDLEDFLKPINHSIIKGKMIAESQEYTTLKYFDVGPKVNILRVTENPQNGRFNILIGIINHESKTDVDIFDVELMSY